MKTASGFSLVEIIFTSTILLGTGMFYLFSISNLEGGKRDSTAQNHANYLGSMILSKILWQIENEGIPSVPQFEGMSLTELLNRQVFIPETIGISEESRPILQGTETNSRYFRDQVLFSEKVQTLKIQNPVLYRDLAKMRVSVDCESLEGESQPEIAQVTVRVYFTDPVAGSVELSERTGKSIQLRSLVYHEL